MNIDLIFATMNRHDVRYLLIGGMNFMLRHEPVLTYDVDFWIEDTADNRRRCKMALTDLDAEWGRTDDAWQPVRAFKSDWIGEKQVFCLMSPHGAIDIFRSVHGLDVWNSCWDRSVAKQTKARTPFHGIADADMRRYQLALAEGKPKGGTMIDEKSFEEQKREKCADPAMRWKVLQETIAWVDSQQPVPRNSRAGCLATQARNDSRGER